MNVAIEANLRGERTAEVDSIFLLRYWGSSVEKEHTATDYKKSQTYLCGSNVSKLSLAASLTLGGRVCGNNKSA